MSIPLHPALAESSNGSAHPAPAEAETTYPTFDFTPWNDERIAVYATLDAALSKALVEAVKALDEMKRTVEQDARSVVERLKTERSHLDADVNQLRVERNKLTDNLDDLRAQMDAAEARKMAAEREVETMLAAATSERERIQRDSQRMAAQMAQMGSQLQALVQQRFTDMWAAFSQEVVQKDAPAETVAPHMEPPPPTTIMTDVPTVAQPAPPAAEAQPDVVTDWLLSTDTPTGEKLEPFDGQVYNTPASPQPPVEASSKLAAFGDDLTVRTPNPATLPDVVAASAVPEGVARVREYASDPTKRPDEIVLKESAEEEQKMAAALAQAVQEGQAVGAVVAPAEDVSGLAHVRVEQDFAPAAPAEPQDDGPLTGRLRRAHDAKFPDWMPQDFSYNVGVADDFKSALRTPKPPVPEADSKAVTTTEVTITELQGFSLLTVERRMRSLPGVRKVTVTDFRRGELSLSVQHQADMHLDSLLPTIPDLNLRLVSMDGTALRLAQKQAHG